MPVCARQATPLPSARPRSVSTLPLARVSSTHLAAEFLDPGPAATAPDGRRRSFFITEDAGDAAKTSARLAALGWDRVVVDRHHTLDAVRCGGWLDPGAPGVALTAARVGA